MGIIFLFEMQSTYERILYAMEFNLTVIFFVESVEHTFQDVG